MLYVCVNGHTQMPKYDASMMFATEKISLNTASD